MRNWIRRKALKIAGIDGPELAQRIRRLREEKESAERERDEARLELDRIRAQRDRMEDRAVRAEAERDEARETAESDARLNFTGASSLDSLEGLEPWRLRVKVGLLRAQLMEAREALEDLYNWSDEPPCQVVEDTLDPHYQGYCGECPPCTAYAVIEKGEGK